MANERMPENIKGALRAVLKENVTEQQQKQFEKLRKQCELFIMRVDRKIKAHIEKGQLVQRVRFLGKLFHGENATDATISDLVKIGHDFQTALNKYLGRKIPLTIVSRSGNIDILSEKTTVEVYKKAKEANKGLRGHVAGYQQNIMNNKIGDPALRAVQKQIDKSIKNRKAVFEQALIRRSHSHNMDYVKSGEGVANSLYWIINDRYQKNWTNKAITSSGFIGEGYASLALQTDPPSILITYQHNPENYVKEAEDQIQLLAERALRGDKIPGILQGDIKVNNGNIQLAIKQNQNFRTAGIGINFGIAYAILHYPQNQLILPDDLQKSLQQITEGQSQKWQAVYRFLTGQVIKETDDINIIIKV